MEDEWHHLNLNEGIPDVEDMQKSEENIAAVDERIQENASRSFRKLVVE